MTLDILNKPNPTVSDVFREVHQAILSNNHSQTIKQLLNFTDTLAKKIDKVAHVKLLGIALGCCLSKADFLDPSKINDLTYQLSSKEPEELLREIKASLREVQIQQLPSPIIIPAPSDLAPPPPLLRDDLPPPPPPPFGDGQLPLPTLDLPPPIGSSSSQLPPPLVSNYATRTPADLAEAAASTPSSHPSQQTAQAAPRKKVGSVLNRFAALRQAQADRDQKRLSKIKGERAVETASTTSNVNLKEKRALIQAALFGEMKQTIEKNDVCVISKEILGSERESEFTKELDQTMRKVAPKAEKRIHELEETYTEGVSREALAQLLESSGTSLSVETKKKIQKYCFYLETLDIDLVKFSKKSSSTFRVEDPDHSDWFQKEQWPRHAKPFVSWSQRFIQDPPQRYDSKDAVRSCIQRIPQEDKIQVSLQLSMNYWMDAYSFCLELQEGHLPEKVQEMGRKMEELLWLKEQDVLCVMGSYCSYNSLRLPQPTDL